MLKRDVLARTVVLLLGAGLCTSIVSADIINVPAGGDIQAAINAASDGDEIQLEAGDYYPSATILLGKAITLRGATDGEGNPTSTIDGQGLMRVLQCFSVSAGTVFENLLITGGNTADYGGGMFNYNSSPTLTGCTFTNNSTDNDGGGMFNYNSSPTLNGCTFTSNSASNGGGMLNDNNSSPTLENCTFEDNSASDSGGGMYNNDGSNTTLTNSILCGNTPEPICGFFTNNGGNCLAFSCTDNDANGIPDKCDDTTTDILSVPSEKYPTIASAIAASGYADIIEIAAGTYFPTDTLNLQGKPITLRGAVDGDGNPTTVIDGQDSIRVLECTSGEGAGTVLENLRITGGYISADSSGGGGMYNNGSSPTLTNCAFVDNSAYFNETNLKWCYGGGMLNDNNSSPTLENCAFIGNWSELYGGGMANFSSSSPILRNCTFTGNSAAKIGGGMYNVPSSSPTLENCTFEYNESPNGAGMYNHYSSPTLTNCTFWENSAYNGGGMFNYNSSPTLTGCTFTNNSTDNDGGGMFNSDSSSPTLENCAFTENEANYYGGGMANFSSSSPILRNCTFTSNSAAKIGGGMYNWVNSSPTLINCVFEDNSANDLGGGMYNMRSIPTLNGCTFTSNSAGSSGGGMYNYDSSSPTLTDTIVCGNSPDQIGGVWIDKGGNCVVNLCGDCDDPPSTDCPGDFNKDGVVDGGDFGNLLVAWGSCPGCPQDLNGDGEVNGADVGLMLSYFGPCPEDYNCNVPHDGPGCNDAVCQEIVCELDRLCCDANFDWDQTCAALAAANCP